MDLLIRLGIISNSKPHRYEFAQNGAGSILIAMLAQFLLGWLYTKEVIYSYIRIDRLIDRYIDIEVVIDMYISNVY